jgi:hypothetical protein
MKFAFFLNQIEEMQNLDRSFELTAQDFLKLNPNTQTCPIFRYRQDAEITQKIYQKNIILINDHQCTETFSVRKSNPWKVSFRQGFFNMTLHKKYFETQNQPSHLALYEAKMMHLYDHRFASYEPQNQSFEYLSPKQQQDPDFRANPRYWVNAQYLPKKLKDQWFIVFRNIVRVTDKRTAIFSIIPKSAVSNSCGLLFLKQKPSFKMIFASICASLPFDYIVRQKIGGTNFNFHYLKQMPMLSPKLFSPKIKHALSQSFPNQSILALIIPKILELYYTANDLSCLCEDLFLDLLEIDPSLIQACHAQWRENQGLAIDDHSNTSTQNHLSTLPPFKWDDLRRAHLKAQLDVIYAKLYQFDFSDLCFILDPINGMLSDHDVHIEAFRVLKNEEIKIYQTFRTKDLIFYYWQKYFGNA